MSRISPEELICRFELIPHPEGGYYRETYRSEEVITQAALPNRFKGPRHVSTSIYFLVPKGAVSRLHRIASDEVWHFYLGDPLEIVMLLPGGQVETIILGQDITAGQTLQHMVPAGCWFGASLSPGGEYAFVGCSVAPGFDFEDFEMGARSDLLCKYPSAEALVKRLTDEV